ncbi:unnamed protein product [Heligmosomoides polygyrus]|uniref:Uncharacterized protein n=1 Tax=Heligmosomoides polygyrus TaxID=6339 RepID=A0A183FMQ8_HELPZ|nr:unnamed protein product [Heligmosomoides polygyrus]
MVLSPVRSASVPPRQATRSKLGDSAEAIEDASNVLRGPVKEYEVACYLKQVVGMLAEATREIRYISRCNKELVEQNNNQVATLKMFLLYLLIFCRQLGLSMMSNVVGLLSYLVCQNQMALVLWKEFFMI